jgi:hypothetical protein
METLEHAIERIMREQNVTREQALPVAEATLRLQARLAPKPKGMRAAYYEIREIFHAFWATWITRENR